ncbi:hypothetical protein HZS_3360, partial [Henneguya salminicola]
MRHSFPNSLFSEIKIFQTPILHNSVNLYLQIEVYKQFQDHEILVLFDLNPFTWFKIIRQSNFTDNIKIIYNVATKCGPNFNGKGFKFLRYIFKQIHDPNNRITTREFMHTLTYLGARFPRRFLKHRYLQPISTNILTESFDFLLFNISKYNLEIHKNQIQPIIREILLLFKIIFLKYCRKAKVYSNHEFLQFFLIFLFLYFDPIIQPLLDQISDTIQELLWNITLDSLFIEYIKIFITNLTPRNINYIFPVFRNSYSKHPAAIMPIFLCFLYSMIGQLDKINTSDLKLKNSVRFDFST